MSVRHNAQSRVSFFIFVAPAFLFFFVFMALPMVGSLLYSFTNWNGLAPFYKFVQLRNYVEIFTEDVRFKDATLFTLNFSVIMVILQNCLALLIANLIANLKGTRKLFRTTFFLPNMISAIVGAYMLKFLFLKVFPNLGQHFSWVGFLNQPWMADPFFAFWAIVLVSLWVGIGYIIIIYLAALGTVPQELEDQVQLDGPNPFQKFIKVTFPMIMPAVTICTFVTINNSFKAFDLIFGLTNGGPGWSTASISLNLYYDAFSTTMRMGYSCAKAIVLFIMILAVSLLQITLMKQREVEL
jgi:raffinose/stachyose/melibiose transport system permease protein